MGTSDQRDSISEQERQEPERLSAQAADSTMLNIDRADKPFWGFVCGLQSEAACLQSCSEWIRSTVSGASAIRARINAEILLAKGAIGLVSFGVSGALHPRLQPGDVIIGDKVVQEGRTEIEAEVEWLTIIEEFAKSCNLTTHRATVLGSNTIITTVDQKRDLAQKFAADAVDMESHAVANVAKEAGKPFLILRTIADSHDRTIPPSALKGVAADGHIQPFNVIASLLTRPQDLPTLLKLGKDNTKAMENLRRSALEVLPLFFRRM